MALLVVPSCMKLIFSCLVDFDDSKAQALGPKWLLILSARFFG